MSNSKNAYPNNSFYIDAKPPYDINKWVAATQEIYNKMRIGIDKVLAFSQITSGWDSMEKKDYENWIKFYEGKNHQKYKTAQMNYYVNENLPGYILPFKQKEKEDVLEVDDMEHNAEIEHNKREIIELQRAKFLSRLNSAEKLLSEEAGHLLAGEDLTRFLEAIHALKREILQVNKKTASNITYIDIIIKNANKLIRNGFDKSASLLQKLADEVQDPKPSPEPTPLPEPISPEPPAPLPPEPEQTKSKLQGFLENLNPVDTSEADDHVIEVSDYDFLLKDAQAIRSNVPQNESIIDIDNEDKDFDDLIDKAFEHVSIEDVVVKLQEISKIFKTREVSRQLTIVDLMLTALNLNTFFPSLSECLNKQLEATQYCNTRIDDILSNLMGTLNNTKDIDIFGDNVKPTSDPKIELIKQKLENDKKKEQERKQLKKDQDEKAYKEKNNPGNISVNELQQAKPVVEEVAPLNVKPNLI